MIVVGPGIFFRYQMKGIWIPGVIVPAPFLGGFTGSQHHGDPVCTGFGRPGGRVCVCRTINPPIRQRNFTVRELACENCGLWKRRYWKIHIGGESLRRLGGPGTPGAAHRLRPEKRCHPAAVGPSCPWDGVGLYTKNPTGCTTPVEHHIAGIRRCAMRRGRRSGARRGLCRQGYFIDFCRFGGMRCGRGE